ncbi:Zn-dependent protease [Ornithinibacillus sp. L9]|uniref:Zn-dependent protease n=1 Tax=Ornithinibacillus caprae TaxID=2678566 RepID=A0A6N8FLR9_9BACI|nr:DUF2268 domain-containing protein [Ornithinibacillus caprae]MUK90415.1 Zn-dependent protease [Ornithinibacillus caprae]
MSVIETDQWLLNDYEDPLKLCERIEDYFSGASASEIYQHLAINGMYRRPSKHGEEIVQGLQDKRFWDIIKWEERKLQKKWNGPDIPILILPSDTTNRTMNAEYNGKSGLAFNDKLFLFLSEDNSVKEIQALFTHEYNHVCRLSVYSKPEEDYVLLDTIILEGLAENAVRERLGEDYTANWTSYYTEDEAEKIWKQIIYPHKDLPKNHRKHPELLYGLKFQPRMAGYCVGYHLVNKYLTKTELRCKDLLGKSSEEIAQIANE